MKKGTIGLLIGLGAVILAAAVVCGIHFGIQNKPEYWKELTISKDVIIPDDITSIPDEAFKDKNLETITMHESVKTIGKSAFENCRFLTSVMIPESVKTIGKSAFENCVSLTSIMIPKMETISCFAFENCRSLTSVTIPESVETIGNSAFKNCVSLTSLMIPKSVETIGCSAFEYCFSLTSVTIPNGVTSIGDSAFHSCVELSSLIIEDIEKIEHIGTNAFSNIKFVKVTINGKQYTTCSAILSEHTKINSNVFTNTYLGPC